MMFNKFSIITSLAAGESIRDIETLKSLIDNIDISRDITTMQGTLDVLDHTSSVLGFGGKLSIDTTNSCTTPAPRSYQGTLPSNIESLLEEWAAIFIYSTDTADFKETAKEVMEQHKFEGLRFAVILNKEYSYLSPSEKLWIICSNCDAHRDTYIYNNTLIIDGRVKAGGINGFSRRWPNVVVMDNKTIKEVDAILESASLEVKPSPSERYAPIFRGEKVDI